MNYLEEIPFCKAQTIINCTDISDLKIMYTKHPGASNVFIRLAIRERIENLMYKMQG